MCVRLTPFLHIRRTRHRSTAPPPPPFCVALHETGTAHRCGCVKCRRDSPRQRPRWRRRSTVVAAAVVVAAALVSSSAVVVAAELVSSSAAHVTSLMVVSSPTAQTCARHSCARRPSGAAPPSAPASATPTSEACSLTPLLAGSLAGCSNPLPARPPRPFSTSPSPAGATFVRTNLSRATFRGANLVRRPRARRRVLVCAPLACAEARGDDTRPLS